MKNILKLKEVPEVKLYWDAHLVNWGNHGISFYADLNPFARLVQDSILSADTKLSLKVLNRVEKFLETADQDSKDNIYFFFEDLTNSLGWQDKKYIKKFVKLLGPHSKDCCRKLDNFWGTSTPGLC